MTRPRDTQKSRLYNAEEVVRHLRVSTAATKHLFDTQRHSTKHVYVESAPEGKRFKPMYYPTAEAAQGYIDQVTSYAWFQRRWGSKRIRVHGGNGSHGGYGAITLSAEHRREESVILHELAHNLTDLHKYAWHGPEFAGVYLFLVERMMGKTHADALRASFKKHGVRKSNAAIPAPTRSVLPVAQQKSVEAAVRRSQKQAARARVTSRSEKRRTAEHLRALIEAGEFGPGTHPTRKAARAVIRALEAQQ